MHAILMPAWPNPTIYFTLFYSLSQIHSSFPFTEISLFWTICDAKQIEQGPKTNSFLQNLWFLFCPQLHTYLPPGLLLYTHRLQSLKKHINLSTVHRVTGRAQVLLFSFGFSFFLSFLFICLLVCFCLFSLVFFFQMLIFKSKSTFLR